MKINIWLTSGNIVEYPRVERYSINNQTIEMFFKDNDDITLVPLVSIEDIRISFEENEEDKEESLVEFYKDFNEVWNDEYDAWWDKL